VLRRDGITVWRQEEDEPVIVDSIEQSLAGDLFPFQRPALRFTADQALLFGSPQKVWREGAGGQPVKTQSLAAIADLDRHGTALQITSPSSFQLVDSVGEPLTPELQCGGREISCAGLSADGSTVLAADLNHHLWVWWLGGPQQERNESSTDDEQA